MGNATELASATIHLHRGPKCRPHGHRRPATTLTCERGCGNGAREPSSQHHSRWDQASAPYFGASCVLRIDDGRGRTSFAANFVPALDVESMMDALDRAVPFPQIVIVIDRAAAALVTTAVRPLAACLEHVEDCVQDLAHIDRRWTPTAFGRADEWSHPGPLADREISGISTSFRKALGFSSLKKLSLDAA